MNVKDNLNYFYNILNKLENEIAKKKPQKLNTSKPDYIHNNFFSVIVNKKCKNEQNNSNQKKTCIIEQKISNETQQKVMQKIHDIHCHLFARSPHLTKKFCDKIIQVYKKSMTLVKNENTNSLPDLNYNYTSYMVHCYLKETYSVVKDFYIKQDKVKPTHFEYAYYCIHILDNIEILDDIKKRTRLCEELKKSKYFKFVIQLSEDIMHKDITSSDYQLNVSKEEVKYYFEHLTVYDPIMFIIYAITESNHSRRFHLSDAYMYVYNNILILLSDSLSCISEKSTKYLYLLYHHCKNDYINQKIDEAIEDEKDNVEFDQEKIKGDMIFKLLEKYNLFLKKNIIQNVYNVDYCYQNIDTKHDNIYKMKKGPSDIEEERQNNIQKLLFLNFLFTKNQKEESNE